MAKSSFTPTQSKEIKDLLNNIAREEGTPLFDDKDVKKYLKGIQNINDEIVKLRKKWKLLTSDVTYLYNQIKGTVDELKNFNLGTKNGIGAFTQLLKISTQFKDDAIGISDLNDKNIKTNIIKLNQLKQQAINSKQLLEINGDINSDLYNSLQSSLEIGGVWDEQLDIAKKRLDYEDKIGKKLGISGGIIKTTTKLLETFGLTNLSGIDELNDELRQSAKNIVDSKEKLGSLKIAGKAFNGVMKEGFSVAKDPLIRFGFFAKGVSEIVKGTLQMDDNVTKLAKSLTITKNQARDVRWDFYHISRHIHDGFTTTKDLMEANIEVGEQLGFNKVYSQDINTEWINITKKMGLSTQSAGLLVKLSVAQGKTLKNTKENVEGIIQNLGAQEGIHLDIRDVMEEIGKQSGQTLANYKGSPEALAKAVTQVRLLGSSMEQTKKQGEYLLNFQSSIESELKAELLTNRSLNLEKARAAALVGDQATVAKELVNQSLDFNQFSKLNVIQQQALAESLGLSSNELGDQLIKLKYQNMSRENIVALSGEETANRMEALSIQDRFNKSIEKLKDIFVGILEGPIGKLLDILLNVLNSPVGSTLIGAGAGFLMGGAPGAIAGAVSGAILGNDVQVPSGYGTKAIVSPEGTIHLNNKDSIIAGNDVQVPSGYGTKAIVSPEGTIHLNNKDSIIAGTDLGINSKENIITEYKYQQPEIKMNLGPLNNIIGLMREDIKQLANKNMSIIMDSRKVGTTLYGSSNKSA